MTSPHGSGPAAGDWPKTIYVCQRCGRTAHKLGFSCPSCWTQTEAVEVVPAGPAPQPSEDMVERTTLRVCPHGRIVETDRASGYVAPCGRVSDEWCSPYESCCRRTGPAADFVVAPVPAAPAPPQVDDLLRPLADPGAYVKRDFAYEDPRWEGDKPGMEELHHWQARAVVAALSASPAPSEAEIRADQTKRIVDALRGRGDQGYRAAGNFVEREFSASPAPTENGGEA
jgi:hypothetical protein